MNDSKNFLSPKKDLIFKALLGNEQNKSLLRSFLNSVLDLDIQSSDEIILKNNEMPQQIEGVNLSKLNIRVKRITSNNSMEPIDIEIKLSTDLDIIEESTFCVIKMYAESLDDSDDCSELGRAIVLNLLDCEMFNDDRWFRRSRFCDTSSKEEMADFIELNFVELPKLSKEIKSDASLQELWLQFLNVDSEEELDMLAIKDPSLAQAAQKLREINADDKLRIQCEQR